MFRAVRNILGGIALAIGLLGATGAMAQTAPEIAGKIQWGMWVDDDGCMHWWADGGLEGYMLDRVNPKTGKPVCLKVNTCMVANTDTLFATDSAKLTAHGRKYPVSYTHLDVYKRQGYGAAYSFKYSARPGTPAAEKPNVADEIADSRLHDLQSLITAQQRACQESMVGRDVGVLYDLSLIHI